MNGVIIFCRHLNNGVYMLSQPVNVVYSIGKHPRLDSVSDIYLWYCRLGHINKNKINRLTQEKFFEVSDCEDRKSTRLNSSHSGESRMPSSA